MWSRLIAQLNFRALATALAWPGPLLLLGVGILGILQPLPLTVAVVWGAAALLLWLPFARSVSPGTGGALLLLSLSALASLRVTYSLALSLPAVLTLLGSVLLCLHIAAAPGHMWRVAHSLLLAGALVSLYFLAHAAYPGLLAHGGGNLPDVALDAPHPNAVAGFVVGILPLGLLAARSTGRLRRLAWASLLLLTGLALLVTGSRGAWAGLLAAASLGALLYGPTPWQRAVRIGLPVAAALLLLLALSSLSAANATPDSLLGTAASRLTLYRNSLNLLKDYPFTGIGAGDTFALVYARYQLLIPVPFLTYAHNLLLAAALSLGAPGLITLIWLLLAFYRFVARANRLPLPLDHRPLFRAAWLGVTAILIHGLTDAVQFSEARWTMPPLFILLGLTLAAGQPASAVDAPPPAYRGPLLAVAVAAATVAVGLFWQPLRAGWYANLGAVAQTKADLAAPPEAPADPLNAALARRYYQQALAIDARQPTANRRLGIIALNQKRFDEALVFLERAYRVEPANQPTLKALGYAYLWSGQPDKAHPLFEQVTFRSRLIDELHWWAGQWSAQDRSDLAALAAEMAARLKTDD